MNQMRKILICERHDGDYVLMTDFGGKTVSRQVSREQGQQCLLAIQGALVRVLGTETLAPAGMVLEGSNGRRLEVVR